MSPEQLYSRILPYVIGCPEPMVDQAIMDATAEFAGYTQADYSIEETVALRDGQRAYYVFGSSGIQPDLVRNVWCNKRELTHVTTTQLFDVLPDWQTAEASEPVYYNGSGELGQINVYPLPRNIPQGLSLRVEVSWKPGLVGRVIPDAIGMEYGREIAEGAKAALMLMPDRKWTNERQGAMAMKKFDDAKVEARLKAIHQNAAGSLSVRPQNFGRR